MNWIFSTSLVIISFISTGFCYPEQGKWSIQFNSKNNYVRAISKTMFNKTTLGIDVADLCKSNDVGKFTIEWAAAWSECFGFMFNVSRCYSLDVKACACTEKNFLNATGQLIQAELMFGKGEVNCANHEYTLLEQDMKTYNYKNCVGVIGASGSIATSDLGKESGGYSKSDGKTQKSDEKTPKSDEKTPNSDEKAPKSDEKASKSDDKTPKSDEKASNSDDKTPKSDEEAPKSDVKTSQSDEKISKTDEKTQKSDEKTPQSNAKGTSESDVSQKSSSRRRRAAEDTKKTKSGKKTNEEESNAKTSGGDKNGKDVKNPKPQTAGGKKGSEDVITTVWKDGQYAFLIKITKNGKEDAKFKAVITTRDDRGKFLSAADFPNLYFYLVMTIIYVLLGFVWLLLLGCYWRDLLRVQYYMGLVIILGLLEKVFYYSEYENVDNVGECNKPVVVIAELVSKLKMTLTLALVIVISVGFGLIKPRLGPTFQKLLAVCFVYFILSSVESCLRVTKTRQDEPSQSELIALIPLALCEVGILWWVFSSLLQTIRTLRLRRNVAKLSLYRHFTNLLIFCLLASVGYLIWFLKEVKFAICMKDIREFWLDTGFWPMLFTVMLFVIMILWRPSINNQRYSHSPLLADDDDDEEDTLMMSEAFDAKKRTQSNGAVKDKRKTREEKVEEDLKWIDDNIPATVADSALQPVLNDSEEEIMTTRFELSKMD